MSGTLYVGTFKVEKPTFALQPYETGPVVELYLGGGPFVEYADVDGLSELIAAAMDARASLAEAQAGEATETRAEVVGVVRDSDVQADPYIDTIAAEHGSEYEPCTCIEGNDAALVTTSVEGCPQHGGDDLPPLPQRVPAGPPEVVEMSPGAFMAVEPQGAEQPAGSCLKCGQPVFADKRHEANDRLTCPASYHDISPEALAAEEPLGSLAPEPQEDEAEA